MNWMMTALRRPMLLAALLATTTTAVLAAQAPPASPSTAHHWAQWRGPTTTGVAPGDAPTRWDDKTNVKWATPIPGRGFSSPIVWGDRVFVTTAVPTGTQGAGAGGLRGGGGGNADANLEHRFDVLALDRVTGRVVWQRTAVVATPHEGYHRQYGSFASNTPVTDGTRVWASFGSRGLYCYDMNGTLVWKRDAGVQMQIPYTPHTLAFHATNTGNRLHDRSLMRLQRTGADRLIQVAVGFFQAFLQPTDVLTNLFGNPRRCAGLSITFCGDHFNELTPTRQNGSQL